MLKELVIEYGDGRKETKIVLNKDAEVYPLRDNITFCFCRPFKYKVDKHAYLPLAIARLSILPELITQGGVSSTKPKDALSIAILQGLTTKEGEISASVLVPEEMDAIPNIIGGARRFPKAPGKFELPLLAVKEASTPTVNSSGQPVQPTNSYKLFAPILQNIDSNLDILKKELVGYGSIQEKYNASDVQMKIIRKHPKLQR